MTHEQGNTQPPAPQPDAAPADANEGSLAQLRQAIIDNTKGDHLFWIGEILLAELEKETGFPASSPSADDLSRRLLIAHNNFSRLEGVQNDDLVTVLDARERFWRDRHNAAFPLPADDVIERAQEAAREWLNDVCGRDKKHPKLEDVFIGGYVTVANLLRQSSKVENVGNDEVYAHACRLLKTIWPEAQLHNNSLGVIDQIDSWIVKNCGDKLGAKQ